MERRFLIDIDSAKRFLAAIDFNNDINNSEFTFQTFPDSDGKDAKSLTRLLTNTIENVRVNFQRKNANGAGVFLTINETDGLGRREKNIVEVRAAFCESDDGPLDISKFGIIPNIIVNSKNGQHAYWLLKRGEDKEKWKSVQVGLIEKFNTDPSIKDLPRVMRIPGFFHRKSDPFMVTMERCEPEPRYTLDELIDGLGLTIKSNVKNLKLAPSKQFDEYTNIRKRCEALLNTIPEYQGVSSGGRDTAGVRILQAIFDFYPPCTESKEIFELWNNKNNPPMEPKHIEKLWNNIQESRSNPFGSALDENVSRQIDGYRDCEWGKYNESINTEIYDVSINIDDMPDFPVPKAGTPLTFGTHKKVLTASSERSEKKAFNFKNRIGALVDDADGDLNHDSSERDARMVSNMLLREYVIRRDDNLCIYIYNGKFWKETTDKFIHKLCMQYDTFNHIEMKSIREASNIALTKRHTMKINWNQLGQTEIALNNGVLDFKTGNIRNFNQSDYLDRIIPYDWNENAECKLWERVLEDWFPGMDEEKAALQEFFGYILCSHAKYKKCLILFGKPDTGKSLACSVAHELAGGTDFVCGIRPDQMDDPKKLATIKGKVLNVVSDLKRDLVLADGGFKMLVSTGDPIQIDQKYTRAENYIPTAKHMFATNNLPIVTDTSGAVFNRLLILPFKQKIDKSKIDAELIEKLKDEMQGIIKWSVRGAIRLHNNKGRWTDPKSSALLIDEYKLYQNPLFFFIKNSGMIEIDDDEKISTEQLRNMMNEFNGSKPIGRRRFLQLLESLNDMYPNLKKTIYCGKSFIRGLRPADSQMPLKIIS